AREPLAAPKPNTKGFQCSAHIRSTKAHSASVTPVARCRACVRHCDFYQLSRQRTYARASRIVPWRVNSAAPSMTFGSLAYTRILLNSSSKWSRSDAETLRHSESIHHV